MIANNDTGVEDFEVAIDGAMGGQGVVLNAQQEGMKIVIMYLKYVLIINRECGGKEEM